MNIGV